MSQKMEKSSNIKRLSFFVVVKISFYIHPLQKYCNFANDEMLSALTETEENLSRDGLCCAGKWKDLEMFETVIFILFFVLIVQSHNLTS